MRYLQSAKVSLRTPPYFSLAILQLGLFPALWEQSNARTLAIMRSRIDGSHNPSGGENIEGEVFDDDDCAPARCSPVPA